MVVNPSPSAGIESTLPKPWEEEVSFHDVLYEWMSRAPWLAISAGAHLLLFLVLMAIPWDLLSRERPTIIQTKIDQAPEEVFEEPPPEELPPILEEEVEDPVVRDADLPEEATEDAPDAEPSEGDPDRFDESPFDDIGSEGLIGIGGNAGGTFGNRFRGPGGRPRGGRDTEPALDAGLKWLKHHQSADGSWDSDGFMANCGKLGPTTCGNPGGELHDAGMTGLALLAFLGDGSTTREGPHRETVARGVKWLKEQQDPDTGLIGQRIGQSFLYDHAIATLALCEAYHFSKSPLLRRTAQDAVSFVLAARNPYGAWRYAYPPDGDNDTSVTGWMVLALKSAEEAGLAIDRDAYAGALSWLDEVTDPATGRCGYDSFGSLSSRIPRVNEHFPPQKGEAMTAVALLSRFFLGQDPATTPIMEQHARLLLETPPEWDPGGFGNDMYYWYYGSYAMFQMGGSRWWEPWRKAMEQAVVRSQRQDGDEQGSWDPVGPWGHAGGRVYSTALMTLCLEVYFRYGKVLGARAARR